MTAEHVDRTGQTQEGASRQNEFMIRRLAVVPIHSLIWLETELEARIENLQLDLALVRDAMRDRTEDVT